MSKYRLKKHILPCQHIRHYPKSLANEQEDEPKIAINQYTPIDNSSPQPGDITIIAAHANGVGKELYEPLWDDLQLQVEKAGRFRIRSIWIADVAAQGESGVLNEGKLGNDPSWYDHPRDLLHMINHFRHEMPRPIVGIGHSMGGNNIANLALIHPRLLTTVILIDPVIQRYASALGNFTPAYMSTFRRDLWPSRKAAAEGFKRNAFYQSWDPRVFDLWIEHGLRDLPTLIHPEYKASASGGSKKDALSSAAASAAVLPSPPIEKPVTLTTSKHHEVFTFMRKNHPKRGESLADHKVTRKEHPDIAIGGSVVPFYRPEPSITFANLPFLRPPCFFIFAEQSPLSPPQMIKDKLDVTGTGVSGNGGVEERGTGHVVMKKAGHFVPFEKPIETAEQIHNWLGNVLEVWRQDEADFKAEWSQLNTQEKTMMDEDRIWWMKAEYKSIDPQRPSKPSKSKL